MDLDKIRGSQWLIVLVHELAHATDDRLAAALPIYNSSETVTRIARLGKQAKSTAQLSRQDLALLDAWLVAGLDRGLLTEVRAWSWTISAYREGLASGLFETIPWIEETFGTVRDSEQTLMPTLKILSPRFVDSRKGIFSLPLVRQRLAKLRRELLDDTLPCDEAETH